MKKTSWKRIGRVGIDSGKILICDPAYIDSSWKFGTEYQGNSKAGNEFSYKGCCNQTIKKGYGTLKNQKGFPFTGTVFTSGLGDGVYDVWARFEDTGKNLGKRIAEVRIILI